MSKIFSLIFILSFSVLTFVTPVYGHEIDVQTVETIASPTPQPNIISLTLDYGRFFEFVKLGLEHIYTGYDHILFLLAVVLVISRLWQVVKAVTAFTLAHSLTLVLSSLGLITLTSRIVEPIIALSIAYVAFENLLLKNRSNIFKRRWAVAFGFGLIHGLGFAGILAEIEIPKDELLVNLAAFNIGIELGQLSILAVVVPLLYLLKRFEWQEKALRIFSLTIGLVGIFWFFERLGLENLILIAGASAGGFLLALFILSPKKIKLWIRRIGVLVLAVLITAGFLLPLLPKPQRAYAAVPSGVIVAWPSTNASIPSGWTRVTALDGRFPKMVPNASTNPGTTGGGSTHDHSYGAHTHTGGSHTHAATTTGQANSTFGSGASTGGGSRNTHTHSTNTSASTAVATSGNSSAGSYGSVTNNPDFFEVIFIKSDGTPTGIPNGAVAWWNSTSLPTGWRATDGAGGAPDLRNRFMRGAGTGADGGTTGGNSGNHSHTSPSHTHPANGTTHNHDVTTNAGGGGADWGGPGSASNNSHDHGTVQPEATDGSNLDANTEASSSNDGFPPWYKLYAIQNNSGSASWPNNIIAMWDGTIVSIPTGWKISDGLNGTPNLLDKYVRALSSTAELGNTGGASTHTHTGSGHTHTSSHSHAGPGNQIATSQNPAGGSPEGSGVLHANNFHGHSLSLPSATVTSGSSSNNAAANTTNEPLFTTSGYIQSQNSTPNAPTIMGSSPIAGSKPNKDAGTITLQGTATDPDSADTVQIDWDYSSNSGVGWTNIGTTSLGAQGATLSLSWTVSGLTPGSGYRLRARTLDNGAAVSSYTTQSADWTLTSGCSPPAGGDLTISTSCAFPETVDGVDNGNLTINTSITLTINAGQTIGFNSGKIIDPDGTIAINDTGSIEKSNIWMVDSDTDGWPATAAQIIQDSSPGGTYRRRNVLQSDRVIDCNDAAASSTNSC